LNIIEINNLSEADRKLIEKAICATTNAYAPYSEFFVGSSCLLSNNEIVTASNMENISYGLTICSEAALLSSINSSGKTKLIKKIALASVNKNKINDFSGEIITPCGRCRQLMLEATKITGEDIEVICLSENKMKVLKTSAFELMPFAFGNFL
jgi:cytidine deaminase